MSNSILKKELISEDDYIFCKIILKYYREYDILIEISAHTKKGKSYAILKVLNRDNFRWNEISNIHYAVMNTNFNYDKSEELYTQFKTDISVLLKDFFLIILEHRNTYTNVNKSIEEIISLLEK